MDDDSPALLRRAPLNRSEWARVAGAGTAPIGVALAVLVPVSLLGPATIVDALVASLVYGGLAGLAAAFVYVDRVHARQCPRCARRRSRSEASCAACGYDLAGSPRFLCSERHQVYVEPGLCRCGRRLVRNESPRGIGREVVAMLKVGAWLLAFLVGVGLVLRLLG